MGALETIMLSKINQAHELKYQMVSLIQEIQNVKQDQNKRKTIVNCKTDF